MVLKRKRKLKKKYEKRRGIDKYEKVKCKFFENGKRCNRNAVGKSTLCEKHGGLRYDPELALDTEQTKEVIKVTNTLFRLDYHPMKFIDLSREGMSPVEIAAEFNISESTLKGWAERYLDFQLAFDVGKVLHESWWLQKGKDGLDKRGFNTPLYKFLTGNKLGYADKVESKNLNLNQNVSGVLVVPEKVSEEEWEANFNG
jgi:hypothetical protein